MSEANVRRRGIGSPERDQAEERAASAMAGVKPTQPARAMDGRAGESQEATHHLSLHEPWMVVQA
jgi:hypothetical protein